MVPINVSYGFFNTRLCKFLVKQLDVFKNLLRNGWLYFYKLILSYLKNLDVFKFDGPELILYITNANRMQDKDKEKWKKA